MKSRRPSVRRLGGARGWPVALAVLLSAIGCERAKGAKQEAAPPPPPPSVVVAEVVERSVSLVRDFTARTEAVPTIEVRARVSGVLEEVLFREGSVVNQGQTLFTIQREEYAAGLASARAQVAKAQADLTRARDVSVVANYRAVLEQRRAELGKSQRDVARYRPLVEAKAIPQQDLDTAVAAEEVAVAGVQAAEAQLRDAELAQRTQVQLAEAAAQAAQASVTQAELNLGYTTIASPIAGIIGKLHVDRGNLVGKAEPTLLATVSAMDPIYVDFAVAEADYLRLARRIQVDPEGRVQGQAPSLELYLADGTQFTHKGRLSFVDRAMDPKTGTIGVRAAFPNPDRLIRPGQFARVRGVVEERANAVLVPQIAVQEQQGGKTVLVVEAGDKVALRPVSLDEAVGDAYIVKTGVKPGDRVVVEGWQKVRPGMAVKPETRAPAAASAPQGPAAAGRPATPAPAAPVAPAPAAAPSLPAAKPKPGA